MTAPVITASLAARPTRRPRWPPDARPARPPSSSTGVSRRYGATVALDGIDLRDRAPARRSRCSARTAPASRPRSG